jgi:N,N'-diacetylchitobiose phosphorylase
VEPYVVAADVYGEEPHRGRGGWTWYTGSAGWMYRIALESILGLRVQSGEWLVLRPGLPSSWPGFKLVYRCPFGRSRYEIEVTRSDDGASRATLDGEALAVVDGAVRVQLAGDGGVHAIRMEVGTDAGRRYEPSS